MDKMEEALKAQSNTLAGTACREKFWAEMSLEEKIERLRQVLQQTHFTAENAAEVAVEAVELTQEHQHSSNGSVLRPARARYVNLVDNGRPRSRHDPLA